MCDKTCNRADSFKSKLNYKVENSHLINFFLKKIYLYHDIVTKSVFIACYYWFWSQEHNISILINTGLPFRDYYNIYKYIIKIVLLITVELKFKLIIE